MPTKGVKRGKAAPKQQVVEVKKWSIVNNVSETQGVQKSSMTKFKEFEAYVMNGMHPVTAAEMSRCDGVTQLRGSSQYELRISQGNRVTFLVDNENKVVTICQIGGHT